MLAGMVDRIERMSTARLAFWFWAVSFVIYLPFATYATPLSVTSAPTSSPPGSWPPPRPSTSANTGRSPETSGSEWPHT